MNVVITGSTKGIGFGMAREFVSLGHNVMVSSRQSAAVDDAVVRLNAAGRGRAIGRVADVANYADVQALWSASKAAFGSVDIWINNAGITTESANIDELPEDQILSVVSTNLIGLMNCCKIAISGMLEQGQGKVFNMEGFGSDGLTREGLSVYGSTKRAVRYFTKSLVKEYASTDLTICYMSPGIVVTDLLTRHMVDSEAEDFQKRKRFLDVLLSMLFSSLL